MRDFRPKFFGELSILGSVVALLLASAGVRAQVAGYAFASSNTTYTPITGGTQLNSGIPDSWVSGAITLSPAFNFGGISYSTAYVTSDGYVTLGGSAPGNEYNVIATTTGSGVVIAPFNADLQASSISGAAAEVRFETIGTEHIFQWKDAMRYAFNDRISFQARLNTSTGVVTFVYGGPIVVGTSTTRQPIVGIRASSTDYKNLKVTAAGAETWTAPLIGTSTSDNLRFTSDATNPKAPASGQTYTFTPNCLRPLNLAVSGGTSSNPTSTNLSWSAPAGGTAVTYLWEVRTSGSAGSGSTGLVASGTTTAPTTNALVTGLTLGTSYSAYVRATCGGTDSSTWTAAFTFTHQLACVAPTSQGSALVLTPASTNVAGAFTAASPAADRYLVVRTTGAVPTAPVNGTSYTAGAGLGGTIVTNLTAPTVTFNNTGLTGNTAYSYYVYAYNSVGCNGGPIYNTASPTTATSTTCPATPGSLSNSAVTATGFTLTWTSSLGGGASPVNYSIEVATNAAFTNQVAGSPFTVADPAITTNITGLAAATQYFYRVRAVGACNSAYATGVVNTLCNGTVFSTFPYVQGFDYGLMPPCWSAATVSGSVNWAPIVGGSGDISGPRWGNGFIEKDYNPSTANLYSPAFNLSGFGTTQARINMWVFRHASALTNDSMQFFINNSASSTGATLLLTVKPKITEAPVVPATGWYNYTADIPLSFNTATPAYIVVRGVTTSTGSYDLGLDSFRVEQVPTCFLPTGVTVTNVTSTGGTIGWTAPTTGAPTSYQYEVRASGAPGSGNPAATGIIASPALTANVTTLASSTAYSVYVRSICGTGDSSLWTLPVTFTTLSNCLPPTAVTASASSSTSLVLNWTASATNPTGGYQYEVRTSGTAGSGATGLIASGSTAAGVNTATVSTGITPSTSYTVYVRSNCGSSNFSVWTTGVTVATPCNSVATFPYTEGFESGTLPACWSTAVVSGTANWSNVVTSSTDISAPFVGAGFIRKPYNTSTANLYSAPFNLSSFGTTQARINVWIYRHANTVVNDSIQFSINTSTSFTGATPLLTIKPKTTEAPTVPSSGWYNYTANIPVSFNTTTPAYIVIQGVTTAGGSSYDLGLDSFRLERVPSCFPTTGVAVSGTTPTTTTINWTAPTTTTPSSYTYEVRTNGTPGSGSTGLVATGTVLAPLNIAAVNNLTPSTTYRVYVRSNCGSTDTSTWTFPGVQFTTPTSCSVPTALTATGITLTSANLGWTAGAFGGATTYQISYGPSGTTAANGTKVSVTANPYTLSNLTSATAYVFFVRAICAPGDTSAWSSSRAFNTLCNNSTLPFVENFGTFLPSVCWSVATGFLTSTASALTPATSTSWGTDQYLNNSTYGPAARINLFTTGKRDWFITPTIDLGAAASNFVLEFNLGIVTYSSGTSATIPTTGVTLGSDDTVAIVVSTDNGATWSRTNALRVWTAANTPISATGTNRYYIPMNGYSGLIKIGFYGGEGTVDDAPDNDIFIDSVRMVTCTAPTVNLGNDTVLCSGASITLNAGVGANYEWSTGATTQTITVSTAGTYSVLAYTTSLGCSRRDTIVVTTGTNPTVNLGPDTTFCSGPAFTLNAGNAGSTYLYNTGATTQTIPVTATGQYSVRVRNAAGCIGRDTVNVTINPTPVVNLGNDTTVCGNVSSFVLNAGSNTGATFMWMGSTVTTQTLNIAPFLNALNNGPIVNGTSYTTSVTVTSPAGCVSRDTIKVTINFSPRVTDFTINGADPTLTFTPVGDSAVTSYAWNFGDGTTAATRVATHTFTTGGVRNVRLVVSNTCGTDTVLKQVQVTSVGNTQLAGANILLYPNPTAHDAVVEVEGGAALRNFQVVSATGALVIDQQASGTRATIHTANLAPGVYTLRIQLDKGVVVRKLEVLK